MLSLCGSILYSTFAINLTWLANGTLDIPAVSILILIMLFTIISIQTNPKYFTLVSPLFVIGIFTRYTVILIFPVLVLYYLYYKGFSIDRTDLKYILIGIIFGILIAGAIYLQITRLSNGYFGANSQITGGINGHKGSSTDLAFNTDTSYYLVNFINFISASKVTFANRTPILETPTINSIAILLILIEGSILFFKKHDFQIKENILPIVILLVALLSFNHISSFITILMTFLGLLLLGKENKNKTGIVMLSWILVHFIFFSYYNIKVNRYIIPTIPPFIYLILSGIDLIHENFNFNKNIIPLALIILFVIQGFTFCMAFETTSEFKAPQDMSEYIIQEIPDYDSQKIGVYNMRPYHWYLGKNITGIESNDTTKIQHGNISYYISDIHYNNLTNFNEIKNIDNLYLYKRSIK